MPRRTRRQMVGKEEDAARQERERSLERLRWELRRLGRLRGEQDSLPWREVRSA
jgi:hypothetical protein